MKSRLPRRNSQKGLGMEIGPPLGKLALYAREFMSTRLEAKSHSILISGSGRV